MKDSEKAILGVGAAYFLTRGFNQSEETPESFADWLKRNYDAALQWVNDNWGISFPPTTPTVAGFTLADWRAAQERGMLPLTAEQLTERWLSAAQMPNVADAIEILFSGQTVDIETVLAAMGQITNTTQESRTFYWIEYSPNTAMSTPTGWYSGTSPTQFTYYGQGAFPFDPLNLLGLAYHNTNTGAIEPPGWTPTGWPGSPYTVYY